MPIGVRHGDAGQLPILRLPWVYAGAAGLLGLPLRVLGRRELSIWMAAAAVGGALAIVSSIGIVHALVQLVGVMSLFPAMLLLPYAWYWPAVLLLPMSAVRLWRYAEPSLRVSDPMAALVLAPGALLLSLLTVQTDWGTPQLWSNRIATWENGELLWGAGQWLFVAALVVWTLLLAAVTSDRVIGRRPRLQRS